MHINKVEICGVNTAKLPIFNAEKKRRLLEQISKGDRHARNEFINGNLRLVLSVIQRFSNRGELIDDLFQIGCVGLIKAVDNFDLTQNVQFSTYAVPMIIGEVRRYLRDNNSVRVSRSLRDTAYKALQLKENMFYENGKEPTMNELAEKLEVCPQDLVFALDAIQEPISLFEPVFQDGTDMLCVMDQIKDKDDETATWEKKVTINDAMKKLEDRERQILSLRFFENKTQMEVAGEIGISQAQVSRLEKSALKHMRKNV
ncbi:MAG: RNA polymerase sporulation sigma factor SigG [Ruminococcaceae bacterium]|nr:RNA polymerase sporulation sigma factor SigG [Oscillospiraceae bacterium]